MSQVDRETSSSYWARLPVDQSSGRRPWKVRSCDSHTDRDLMISLPIFLRSRCARLAVLQPQWESWQQLSYLPCSAHSISAGLVRWRHSWTVRVWSLQTGPELAS